MREQYKDLFIKTKETGSIIFKVKLAKGERADLTGWTSHFVVKKDKDAADTSAVLNVTNSTWEEGKEDIIPVAFTQSFTDRAPAQFYYSLFLTKDSDLTYLSEGNLFLEQGGSK